MINGSGMRVQRRGGDAQLGRAGGARRPFAVRRSAGHLGGGAEMEEAGEGGEAAPRGAVVWFRQDLRLDDNQAFRAAVRAAARGGGAVMCVFVWSEEEEGDGASSWAPGEASKVWLHHALAALDRDVRGRYGGGGVHFVRGEHAPSLVAAAAAVNATAVFATKRHEPAHVRGDAETAARLSEAGIELVRLPGHLLFDPERVEIDMRNEKYFFGTLMPYLHAAEKMGGKPGAPKPPPTAARILDVSSTTPGDEGVSTRVDDRLHALGLIPASDRATDWSVGIRADWNISEAGAVEAWEQFVRVGLAKYEDDHGRTDVSPAGVSRLSPYLRFGQLSPRRMYHELSTRKVGGGEAEVEGRKLSRLFWHRLYRREFAYWQLHNWPDLATRSVRRHYEGRADWQTVSATSDVRRGGDGRGDGGNLSDAPGDEALRRWQTGTTGFPAVDVGMRRLWATGWMHQTERMIAATFLVDYCGVHWTHGARWFHDCLVDADLAINAMMWQNAGKSGLDQWDVFAAGLVPDGSVRAHDPDGEAIARWCPELAGLPKGHLRHRPWDASPETLAAAGVELGVTYPHRLMEDPDRARRRMVKGVTAVRVAEIDKAAAAASEAAGEGEGAEPAVRSDVLVDVKTGADYVVAPPGATKEAGGALLPLSTRKEFKAELRADARVKAAMTSAMAWAATTLNLGATGAAAASLARPRDVHTHSHVGDNGRVHFHSHGGHSHGPNDLISDNHIGHTHGSGGAHKAAGKKRRGGKAGGRKKVVDHRSSGWALSGNKRAARGMTAKEAERAAVKAGRREAREIATWGRGMDVASVKGRAGSRGRRGWVDDDHDHDDEEHDVYYY